VHGQSDEWRRFAVITYDASSERFVYYARRYDNKTSSYICQLQLQGRSFMQFYSTLLKCVLSTI